MTHSINHNSIIWDSKDAENATNGQSTAPWQASSVEIDSRQIKPGSLFIAIKGPNNDGHDYVQSAFENGAAAAIVHADLKENFTNIKHPLLYVTDTTKALYDLAAYARQRTQAKIIAITGSVGKTGTKEGLKAAFSNIGKTHATIGNLNNEYGLPLTMARMPADSDYAILEMGMNHPEEIRPLSKLAQPHIAIITTIAPVHLEFFNDVKEIAAAKSEIFDGVIEGGQVLIPADHEYYTFLANQAYEAGIEKRHILGFGKSDEAIFKLFNIENYATETKVEADLQQISIAYRIKMPGEHWAINSLSILAAVSLLSSALPDATEGLKSWAPGKGRGEKNILTLPKNRQVLLIDESYNASPPAMAAAFTVLAETAPFKKQGRHIAILGDMRELGEASQNLHNELATQITALNLDKVYCCGPFMKPMFDSLPDTQKGFYSEKSESLLAPLLQDIQDGDILMIKGSLGSKMVPLAEKLLSWKNTFPDIEKTKTA